MSDFDDIFVKPRRFGDRTLPRLKPRPTRRVEEMTPADVRNKAAREVERLKREIAEMKKRLAKAETDLAFWKGIK